jgi:hypothetical protein
MGCDIVQQVSSIYQCFDGSLNAYLDKCLEIIALFDNFTLQHVFRDENIVANNLAQQAWGFQSSRRKLYVLEKSDIPVSQTGWSYFWSMQDVEICSIEPSSAKLDSLISETGGSRILELRMI